MPCVRAATATVGVLLDRARVPREIRRAIYAMAFALPDDAERRAERARNDTFLRAYTTTTPSNVTRLADAFLRATTTPAAGDDPPLLPGALEAASEEMLLGTPGLTGVTRALRTFSESPEAYILAAETHQIAGRDFAEQHVFPLYPFESGLPALLLPRDCRLLTIRSICREQEDVCLGGDVRRLGEFRVGDFALREVERTFAAPRTSSSGVSYFTVSELARAVSDLPERWRQVGRCCGLVAYRADGDEALSLGRFTRIPAAEDITFGSCTLEACWDGNLSFRVGDDGRAVLDVTWHVMHKAGNLPRSLATVPVVHGAVNPCILDICQQYPSYILRMWSEGEDAILQDAATEAQYIRRGGAMHILRRNCVDFRRWAPPREMAQSMVDRYLEPPDFS